MSHLLFYFASLLYIDLHHCCKLKLLLYESSGMHERFQDPSLDVVNYHDGIYAHTNVLMRLKMICLVAFSHDRPTK